MWLQITQDVELNVSLITVRQTRIAHASGPKTNNSTKKDMIKYENCFSYIYLVQYKLKQYLQYFLILHSKHNDTVMTKQMQTV